VELLHLLELFKDIHQLLIYKQKLLLQKFILRRLGHRANLCEKGVDVTSFLHEIRVLGHMNRVSLHKGTAHHTLMSVFLFRVIALNGLRAYNIPVSRWLRT